MASATAGAKCGMFRCGPFGSERELAFRDSRAQSWQRNKGLHWREVDELLLVVVMLSALSSSGARDANNFRVRT